MELADIVAAYAAIVSTALAIFQVSEIRRRSRYVVVSGIQYFGDDATWLEVKIENRGGHACTLHNLSFGTCARRWQSFWRLEEHSFVGICEIVVGDAEPPIGGKPLEAIQLQPGGAVFGIVTEQDVSWATMTPAWVKKPPSPKNRYISVEHSQSDEPLLKRVSWEPR